MGTSFQVDEGNMRGVKVYDRRYKHCILHKSYFYSSKN